MTLAQEQANGVKLCAWKEEVKTNKWWKKLPIVVLAMNTPFESI